MRVIRASDRSVLLQWSDVVDPHVVHTVIGAFRALRDAAPAWLVDLHPAYASLLVEFDATSVEHDEVEDLVRALAEDGSFARAARVDGKTVVVPVRYGGDEGPDLALVAAHTGLSPAEVVARHAAARYQVAFLGFSPGFAYLLGLSPALATPRRGEPRAAVPAGSVAIGGAQTGVYPSATPGGWNVIGRTSLVLGPDWVEPGDVVNFVATERP